MTPSPTLNHHSKAVIDYLYSHFIKGMAVQKTSKPGFNHALQLSYQTMELPRLSVGPQSLTYRYKTSPKTVPRFSMGLLTAVMDELTTVAVFRVGLPSQPGVSLHMSTERIDPSTEVSKTSQQQQQQQHTQQPQPQRLEDYHEIDVINTVTKLGKTVAHTRTEYRCPDSQQLLATSSHIKYLPMGSLLLDYVFTSPWAQSLYYKWVLQSAKIPSYDNVDIYRDVIRQYLQWNTATTANTDSNTPLAAFTVTTLHTNPVGGMHGGCHVMIMEEVATRYARRVLSVTESDSRDKDNPPITLQSLQVEFLSAAPVGAMLDVVCQTTAPTPGGCHVLVQLKRKDRVVSEGRLRFERDEPPRVARL